MYALVDLYGETIKGELISNKTGMSLRAQRSDTRGTQRRYSLDEVQHWCQTLVDQKSQLLLAEINENNSIIRILSEKLTKAETDLEKREKVLQLLGQRIFQNKKTDHVELLNKLLNDKLRDKFEHVNRALGETKCRGQTRAALGITEYQRAMESTIHNELARVKAELKVKVTQIKEGNERYWGKIKSWAKTFDAKERKCEDAITSLHKEIKSVEQMASTGLLGTFKLKSFSNRLREIEQSMHDVEESFKVVGQRQVELKGLIDGNEYKITNIELSYSKDDSAMLSFTPQVNEPTASNQQFQTTADEYYTRKSNCKFPSSKDCPSESQSIPCSDIFKMISKRSSPGRDYSVLSSIKSDDCRFSFSSRIQSLQNMSNHMTHSRITSTTSTKSRLNQLIQSKSLSTPIPCRLDQLRYLKSTQDNYLFDCEGNMFKLSEGEFRQLCQDGMLLLG